MGVSTAVEGKRKSVNSIARESGYSLQAVQRFIDLGMPQQSPDCFVWMVKRQRDQLAEIKKRKEGGNSLSDQEQREKIAVLKERKRALRMERRRRKGELVERVAVMRQWKRKVTEARVQIESIPSLASQYVPEGDTRAIVLEETAKVVNRALKGLARGKSADSEPE